jgi:streptomycin 6-kinase
MQPEFPFPARFVATNIEERGQEGVEWLARLPSILAVCERRWSLRLGPPFQALSYNYAAPAVRADGTSVVVKVCVADRDFLTEVQALRLYDGVGAVRLYEFDLDLGVMVLEHLMPGVMLSSVESDEEATAIAASVMQRIWHPPPADHPFGHVSDWARGMEKLRARFDGGSGPFPERVVQKAEGLFADLLASMAAPVVLHGDLHHFNILSAERMSWLAIDPKGIIGEPAYETGAFIRNPSPDIYSARNLNRLLDRRIRLFADLLAFDPARVYGWATAQALLSAWWTFEDNGGLLTDGFRTAVEFAETLAELPGW